MSVSDMELTKTPSVISVVTDNGGQSPLQVLSSVGITLFVGYKVLTLIRDWICGRDFYSELIENLNIPSNKKAIKKCDEIIESLDKKEDTEDIRDQIVALRKMLQVMPQKDKIHRWQCRRLFW